MPAELPIVGSFLLIFLPALALFIAGLVALAHGAEGPTPHRSIRHN